jgi:hypothetical protein
MPIFPTGVFSATNPTPTTSRASGTTGKARRELIAALGEAQKTARLETTCPASPFQSKET